MSAANLFFVLLNFCRVLKKETIQEKPRTTLPFCDTRLDDGCRFTETHKTRKEENLSATWKVDAPVLEYSPLNSRPGLRRQILNRSLFRPERNTVGRY
jgi:hypothetical protein